MTNTFTFTITNEQADLLERIIRQGINDAETELSTFRSQCSTEPAVLELVMNKGLSVDEAIKDALVGTMAPKYLAAQEIMIERLLELYEIFGVHV